MEELVHGRLWDRLGDLRNLSWAGRTKSISPTKVSLPGHDRPLREPSRRIGVRDGPSSPSSRFPSWVRKR